jgi:addiction module HigA family antidote
MLPENRIPTHPGEILLTEFLEPLGMTQVALAKAIRIPVQRVNEIVRGKRGVTPETAWLLAKAFGTTPQFWANLQSNHDLAVQRPAKKLEVLERIAV